MIIMPKFVEFVELLEKKSKIRILRYYLRVEKYKIKEKKN